MLSLLASPAHADGTQKAPMACTFGPDAVVIAGDDGVQLQVKTVDFFYGSTMVQPGQLGRAGAFRATAATSGNVGMVTRTTAGTRKEGNDLWIS
jgi:hypothetical protein